MTSKKQKNEEADKAILAHIREIILNRPTYGYRRVTAILNAQRHALEQTNINHKWKNHYPASQYPLVFGWILYSV